MADAVILEFLARQFERVLDRLGAIEDQMTVQAAITQRLDATVGGLTAEVRALHGQIGRFANRLQRLEEHAG